MNYTIAEKEMLAVVKSILNFRNIIFGSRIIVKTDNKNNIFPGNYSNDRIQCWKWIIQEYDVIFEHVKGKENTAADFLSRMHLIKNEENSIQKKINKLLTIDGENKILTYDKFNRVIIENSKIDEIIRIFHEELGHVGPRRLWKTLKMYFAFSCSEKNLKNIIRKCKECQRNKNYQNNLGKLAGYIDAKKPFERICIDVYGPLTSDIFKKEEKNTVSYIVSIIDVFTRLAMFKKTSTTKGKDIVNILKNSWILKYGKPKNIITDLGRQFLSDVFIEFCKSENIIRSNTTAYNPTGNSVVERIHQTLGNNLRIFKNVLSIDEIIIKAENNLNLCYHHGIEGIPIELAQQKNPINMGDRKFKFDNELNFKIQNKIKEKELNRRNKKRRLTEKLQTGDVVMVKNEIRRNKFDEIWLGPYEILDVKEGNNLFKLIKENRNTEWINLKRLRRVGKRGQNNK